MGAGSRGVRAAILEAGAQLLHRQGVTALTQPRVAAAAGVKQSHLTYYFPKRGDLLLGIAEHSIGAAMAELDAQLETARNLRQVGDSIAAVVSRSLSPRVMLGLVVAADVDPALRPPLRRLIRGVRRRISGLMAKTGLPAGADTTALFHATVVGFAVLHHARRTPASAREIRSGVGRLLALTAALGALAACGDSRPQGYQGYFEGEYLYLAAPQSGYLKSLDSERGARVGAGQALFAVAADPDDQALTQAEAQASSAREKLENLKAPHRPPEVAALEADVRAAEASLALAVVQLRRQQDLLAQKFVPQSSVDQAQATRDQAAAQVQVAREQLATYRISLGRNAEVRGAQADLDAAAAAVQQKRWVVDRKTVLAPAAGEITETYYRPGEWVPAGAPVASLLPDARRRLRFFVPEAAVGALKPGDKVEAHCDGCAAPVSATITYIAPQAEFTPPVIYSQGMREKLVFRVDAYPEAAFAATLRPGLPADVTLRPVR